VRVDVHEGKVLGELPIDDETQSVGHFGVTSGGQILALCFSHTQSSCGLYYSPTLAGPLRRVKFSPEIQAKLKGEMLSIALNADQTRAIVTNPLSSTIILVDMKTGEVLKTKEEAFLSVAFNPKDHSFFGAFDKLRSVDETLTDEGEFTLSDPHPSLNGNHSILVNV
jgi:hypothetical protein